MLSKCLIHRWSWFAPSGPIGAFTFLSLLLLLVQSSPHVERAVSMNVWILSLTRELYRTAHLTSTHNSKCSYRNLQAFQMFFTTTSSQWRSLFLDFEQWAKLVFFVYQPLFLKQKETSEPLLCRTRFQDQQFNQHRIDRRSPFGLLEGPVAPRM